MIISIRGTNGSGKTTVITDLMAMGTSKAIYGLLGIKRPEAYELLLDGVALPVYILGPYNVPTGGCDQITHYDSIIALIDKYRSKGHVVFEGVIVGSVWGRVGAVLDKCGKLAVLMFLDTSLDECLRRVQHRRDGRGDVREYVHKNTIGKYTAVAKIREKALAAGLVRVVDTASEKGSAVVRALLGAA